METMGTDQLLDLFNLSDQAVHSKRVAGDASSTIGVGGAEDKANMNAMLKTLPELWEDKQYEEEYDLTQFMDGLRKQ